jgi:hypothetical protein
MAISADNGLKDSGGKRKFWDMSWRDSLVLLYICYQCTCLDVSSIFMTSSTLREWPRCDIARLPELSRLAERCLPRIPRDSCFSPLQRNVAFVPSIPFESLGPCSIELYQEMSFVWMKLPMPSQLLSSWVHNKRSLC